MKKLKLFVLGALLATPTLAEWQVEIKTDPISDMTVARMYTASAKERNAMFVRCRGKEFDMYFYFGRYMDNDPFKIEYRVDKNNPRVANLNPSTDGTSGFLASWEAKNLIEQELLGGTAMVVRGYDFRGSSHIHNFSLIGFNDAWLKIKSHCKR